MTIRRLNVSHRILAALLAFCMIAAMLPTLPLVTEATTEEPLETIFIASDFQYTDTEAGKTVMSNIADAIIADGITKVDSAMILGDYNDSYGLDGCIEGIDAVQSVLTAKWGLTKNETIFVQGNHEVDYYGAYKPSNYDPAYYTIFPELDSYLADSGNNDQENYGVFVINEVDYAWENIGGEERVQQTADALEAYLQDKLNKSYDKPIFIAAHVELNYSKWTNRSWNAKHGAILFDVLNKYGELGLNIIYMYGHAHGLGYGNYLGGGAIYLPEGETMMLANSLTSSSSYEESEPMHFTYLLPGYLCAVNPDYEGVSYTSNYDKSSATIVQIYSDRVELTRYDADGKAVMKAAGVEHNYADLLTADTAVYNSPQTIELDQFSLELELGSLSDGVMHVGDTGVVELVAEDGKSYEATWTSSDPDIVSVDGSGLQAMLTAKSLGTATITVTPALDGNTLGARTFQIAVVSEDMVPSQVVTIAISETIYKRQPSTWDNALLASVEGFTTEYPFLIVAESKKYADGAGIRQIMVHSHNTDSNGWYTEVGSIQANAYVMDDGTVFIKDSELDPNEKPYWYLEFSANDGTDSSDYFVLYNKASGSAYLESLALSAGNDSTLQKEYGLYVGTITPDSVASMTYANQYAWRFSGSGNGIQSTDAYRMYYDASLQHFAANTSAATRVYLYYQDTLEVNATAQLNDIFGYVSKGVPSTVSTGDTITWTKDGVTTQIPVTVGMLSGNFDVNTPGTYGNLTVTYNGVEIIDNYTLIVRDSATLLQNDGSTTGTSSIFKLATSLQEGKNYVVVNRKIEGYAHILGYVSDNDSTQTTDMSLTTESYNTVVRELTVGGETGLYVDASIFEGVNHSSAARNIWKATTSFTDADGTVYTAPDGTYYFVNANTGVALKNGKTVTNATSVTPVGEPYAFVWGDDYDQYGLQAYNVFNSGNQLYLRYNVGNEVGYFTTWLAKENYSVYLYEQVTDLALISAYLSDHTGTVEADDEGATLTGDAVVVETVTHDGSIATENVPVALYMVGISKEQLAVPGTYTNLTVIYNGVVICDDYTLVVTENIVDNYPDFPEEGAVRVDKTLDTSKYNYLNTGAASINLSVTGVPKYSGADVMIVIDTSSSMNNCIHGKYPATCEVTTDCPSRISILRNALQNMLLTLNSQKRDVDIAIVDFNGYYAIGNGYRLKSSSTDVTENTNDASQLYLPFTDVAGLTGADITGVVNSITTSTGTNYDMGLDWAYKLLYDKQIQNSVNDEKRESYVMFMSDGAPWQYNYILGNANGKIWEDYINGNLQELVEGKTETALNGVVDYTIYNGNIANCFSSGAQGVWEEYYNPDGKHWMAEAIKGDSNTFYKVIDPDYIDVYPDGIMYAPGLDATMISIGFGISDDGQMEADDCKSVLKRIATSEEHYYDVTQAEQLTEAFNALVELVQTAGDAVFTDQMTIEFDVITYNKKAITDKNNVTTTVEYNPAITIRQYELYKRSEIGQTLTFDSGDVLVTEAMVGTRKPVDPVVLETVTFNDDGTQAYSNQLSGNILNADGVICAKYFYYNTDRVDSHTVGSVTVEPKSFYWIVGEISQNELVLTYDVYLNGSMEGTRSAGTYNTNNYAELNYTNYLGNPCVLSADSPKLPWSQANVGYGFYLVNNAGKPIINQTTGVTGSFDQSIRITKPVYIDFTVGASSTPAVTIDADEIAAALPEGYELFDTGASYGVGLNSSGVGQYVITKGSDDTVDTTYVVGVGSSPVTGGAVGGETVETSGFATGNTIVWFAVVANVKCIPDAVVIDYGLPVEVDVLTNDSMMGTYGELCFVGSFDAFNAGYEAAKQADADLKKWEYLQNLEITTTPAFASDTFANTLGTATVLTDDEGATTGKVRFALDTDNGMQMNDTVEFVYAVHYTGSQGTNGYYYSIVTVIPATSIYYEDDFVDFHVYDYESEEEVTEADTNYDALKWQTAGAAAESTQAQDRPGSFSLSGLDANNIYGYDAAYRYMGGYSNGSAMMVNVGEHTIGDAKVKTYATAAFTFYGTGFDIISLCSNTTGTIVIKITDADNKTVANYLVDTYYGYKYADTNEDGVADAWVVDEDAENALYQVPVIKVDLNTVVKTADDADTTDVDETEYFGYGKYTVTLIVSYADMFGHNQYENGSYDFYLDAIRIYDPANDGASNAVIKDAYLADGEGWPSYEEVRNMLIEADKFKADTTNTEAQGLVFIDNTAANKTPTIADYTSYGPNNEVYLAPGQGITFKLDIGNTDNIAGIHIGVKSVGGTGRLKIYNSDVDPSIIPGSNVYSATELYYNLTQLNGKTVVLYNMGTSTESLEGAIISITNIKVTYKSDPNQVNVASYFNASYEIVQKGIAMVAADYEVDSPNITLGSPTLLLEDSIKLNVYYTIDQDIALDKMGMIVWTEVPSVIDISTADAVYPGAIYNADNGNYSVQTDGIPAQNLGDTIYFCIYAQLEDGSYVYGKQVSYSPATYAYNQLNGSATDAAKALYVAILNYGAAAQTYLDYKTDALINANLTDGMKAYVDAYNSSMVHAVAMPDAAKQGEFAANGGFSAKKPSISLDGAFGINYYFTPSAEVSGEMTFYYWNEEDFAAADVLRIDNATGSGTMTADSGVYGAAIEGIAAKDIDSALYACGVYTDANGNTYSTGILPYSLGVYCGNQATSGTEKVQPLAAAIAVYGYYAANFFAGN